VQDNSQLSPETREAIDNEVRRIVGEQYGRAQDLLGQHRAALETLATELLQRESLDGSAVTAALGGMVAGPGLSPEETSLSEDFAAPPDAPMAEGVLLFAGL